LEISMRKESSRGSVLVMAFRRNACFGKQNYSILPFI
jgi:hypothetical protein